MAETRLKRQSSRAQDLVQAEASAQRRLGGPDEDFGRFLARLDPNRDHAWELYGELRQKLLLFFVHHGYSLEAEDLSDEVVDTIVRSSDLDVIKNVSEFAFGVARNVRLRMPRRRRRTTGLEDADGLPASPENPEGILVLKLDGEKRLACFRKCWQQLTGLEQELLSEYYPDESAGLQERRERLAQTMGMNMNNLRIRVFRLKDKLESCTSRSIRDEK